MRRVNRTRTTDPHSTASSRLDEGAVRKSLYRPESWGHWRARDGLRRTRSTPTVTGYAVTRRLSASPSQAPRSRVALSSWRARARRWRVDLDGATHRSITSASRAPRSRRGLAGTSTSTTAPSASCGHGDASNASCGCSPARAGSRPAWCSRCPTPPAGIPTSCPASSAASSRRATCRSSLSTDCATPTRPTYSRPARTRAWFAERLGHADVSFTLQVYGHVLPGQQADAPAAVAKLVDGI